MVAAALALQALDVEQLVGGEQVELLVERLPAFERVLHRARQLLRSGRRFLAGDKREIIDDAGELAKYRAAQAGHGGEGGDRLLRARAADAGHQRELIDKALDLAAREQAGAAGRGKTRLDLVQRARS